MSKKEQRGLSGITKANTLLHSYLQKKLRIFLVSITQHQQIKILLKNGVEREAVRWYEKWENIFVLTQTEAQIWICGIRSILWNTAFC